MIEIEDLKKVKLEKDDILVFQLEDDKYFGIASQHVRKQISKFFEHFREHFNVNFIVIPSSMKLTVMNKEDIQKEIKREELKLTEENTDIFDPDNLVR